MQFSFRECFFRCRLQPVNARSSAVWSCCKPPSNRDNGHESTIWLVVCFCPQLQDSDVDRPHWCKSAQQVPRPVRKRFSIDQVCRGRSKPGCRIVGSGTKDWLTTGVDVQTSLHWAFMSTGVMSDDQIGLRDARRAGGWLNTSLNPGQFG